MERLIHVLGGPEFDDLRESPVDLVTQDGDDVVARDHILFVDESFDPNFGVDFVSCLQVLRDVVLLLVDADQLLRPVDVDP